ncbi:MAG: putative metal-binding motif-containing protein [Polyangiaceae bacterium]|nr:putative metal-binding motif-containing protein [Polyangiaceae bacterium]
MRRFSSIKGKVALGLFASLALGSFGMGCVDESPQPSEVSERERMFPTERPSDDPDYDPQSVTVGDLQSCLAGPGQASNITGVSMFGDFGQSGTSTAMPCQPGVAGQCTFAPGDCYFVVSGGPAATWNTSSSVDMSPGCVPDPVFGTLCDVGGATVSVFVPTGTNKITFDYRFFEWDYVPFEDPFAVTLYNPANQPVASTGSQNSCEFSNKTGSALAIGNLRTVEFNVSAYQGQTVKLEFRASDRYDNVLDAGALVNNLQVVSGAMSCAQPVCGGCASAAACAAVDADGDGVNACTDCNDNNAGIKPGNSEICNGQDDNCTGVADEGGVCCVDNDSDGYTGCNGDCNDNNAAIKPGATEVCDGADNDCNGLIDFIGTTPVCAPPDDDNDGWNQNDDCNDNDATVYPGAAELCDFKDNDCDGNADEGTCQVGCVTIEHGVNGGVSEDAALLGDYPNSPDGLFFGAWTGVSSAGNENVSLFRFDLSGVEAAAGTQNINVTSATFKLAVAWNASYNQVSVHGCNLAWSEATVTYNNYPKTNCDTNPVTSFNAGGPGFRNIDVTTLAQQWLTGERDNHGMMIQEAPVNTHYYYTKNPGSSLQPKLEVCYFLSNGDAPPPGN